MFGRNNQISTRPLCIEYDVTAELDFQFITDQNQIIDITGLSGLALAIGLQQNRESYDLLALSKEYTIEDNVLKFTVNTYTTNWLKDIKKNATEAYIEISQKSIHAKRVLLRSTCLVWPRTYVEGLSPAEIASNDYFTKEETTELVDEKIDAAISGLQLSGYVTDEEFEAHTGNTEIHTTAEEKAEWNAKLDPSALEVCEFCCFRQG